MDVGEVDVMTKASFLDFEASLHVAQEIWYVNHSVVASGITRWNICTKFEVVRCGAASRGEAGDKGRSVTQLPPEQWLPVPFHLVSCPAH